MKKLIRCFAGMFVLLLLGACSNTVTKPAIDTYRQFMISANFGTFSHLRTISGVYFFNDHIAGYTV